MAKRLFLMLAVVAALLTGLGFLKFKQVQSAMAAGAYTPPPEAVTSVVAKREQWPSTMCVIGTMEAVQGVMVSADLPGTVAKINFDSGKAVREGDVLVELDTRQERAQLAALEAQRDLAKINYARNAATGEGRRHFQGGVRPSHRSAKADRSECRRNPRDHCAKDNSRAVFGSAWHPQSQSRPVSFGRKSDRSAAVLNPIYVNFGFRNRPLTR